MSYARLREFGGICMVFGIGLCFAGSILAAVDAADPAVMVTGAVVGSAGVFLTLGGSR